jgi:hypothetical protein
MDEDKNKIPVNNITGRNTPNDDEEVLKNEDEPIEDKIKNNKESKPKDVNERSEGSETLGIP